MTALEKVILDLLEKGVPIEMIEEAIGIASKSLAAEIVRGGFSEDPSEEPKA